MGNVVQLLFFVAVAIVWGLIVWSKQKSQAGERQPPGEPGEPPRPVSGLDEIRRFLLEISQPPKEEPTEPTSTMLEEAPRARPAPPSRPGRPPTRRPAAVERPPRPRPSPAPGVVPEAPPVAPAPVRRPRPRPRPGPAPVAAAPKPRVPAREVVTAARRALGVERTRQQAAAMLREVRGELAAGRPVGLAEVAGPVGVGGYRTTAKAARRSLFEVIEAVKRPGARAIVLSEIIGAPVGLRGPERISAHYL